MSSSSKTVFLLFLMVYCSQGLEYSHQYEIPRYNSKTFFLPNYARSFPGYVEPSSIISTNPVYNPAQQKKNQKVADAGTSFRDDLTGFNEGLGFHLGSELEARTLDLSAIFKQPVSTLELLNQARLRLLSPTINKDNSNLLTVIISPPTIRPSPSSNDLYGDSFNPFFRPVYARPPPPPLQPTTTKSPTLCNCPCTSPLSTTEASSVGTTVIRSHDLKVTTDQKRLSAAKKITLQNTDLIVADTGASVLSHRKNENHSDLQRERTVETHIPSTLPSVAQLVELAFNSTRQNNLEDNSNTVDSPLVELIDDIAAGTDEGDFSSLNSDREENTSNIAAEVLSTEILTQETTTGNTGDDTSLSTSTDLPQGRTEMSNVTGSPVGQGTIQPTATLSSTSTIAPEFSPGTETTPDGLVSTKFHVQEKTGRAPKKAGLVDELLLPVPKQIIPGIPGKGSNRRFNSLLDLSMRRSGHKA